MAWYRVRVSESQRHTTTQKYTEYPPPPPPTRKHFCLGAPNVSLRWEICSEGLTHLKSS